jgi:succinate dehydrogenase / fumarate reductase, cytochrome b subunit
MNFIKRLFQSSVGLKFVMAATGTLLFVFLVAHLVGNLQFFLGPDTINAYGHLFQENEKLRWPIRVSLLLVAVLHVASALRLYAMNRSSRPQGYAGNPAPVAASYAARSMVMTGLIVAVFILYHLLHFTVRVPAVNLTGQDFNALTEPTPDGQVRHDIFHMMVLGYRQPLVAAFYVLGVGLLSLHLSHGLRAMFQSIGLRSQTWDPVIDRAARIVGWVIFLAFSSIPIAVLCGFGRFALH